MPILEHFVDRTPGSFVEERKYALLWHNRTAEPEFGAWLANELVSMLEAMLAETELRAFRGEKRSEEHTSELQSRGHLVCRLLLEKKKIPTARCASRPLPAFLASHA